jgi:nuclear pore complex protein Nup54
LKPGPGYVPVLCTGFSQLAERLTVQASNLAVFNSQLHQINVKLGTLLHDHETSTSIRAMDARRKHTVLKRRCLVLATKVQILRNRGYAMGGDEEDLKAKLLALEKGVSDPGLDARQEEIWARMVTVQERARLLKAEIERNGQPAGQILDEQTTKRAQKV